MRLYLLAGTVLEVQPAAIDPMLITCIAIVPLTPGAVASVERSWWDTRRAESAHPGAESKATPGSARATAVGAGGARHRDRRRATESDAETPPSFHPSDTRDGPYGRPPLLCGGHDFFLRSVLAFLAPYRFRARASQEPRRFRDRSLRQILKAPASFSARVCTTGFFNSGAGPKLSFPATELPGAPPGGVKIGAAGQVAALSHPSATLGGRPPSTRMSNSELLVPAGPIP